MIVKSEEELVIKSSACSSTNHLVVPDANCQGKQELIIQQADEQFVVLMPQIVKDLEEVKEGYIEFSPVNLPPASSDSEEDLPLERIKFNQQTMESQTLTED